MFSTEFSINASVNSVRDPCWVDRYLLYLGAGTFREKHVVFLFKNIICEGKNGEGN